MLEDKSSYKPTFTSADSALRVLRRGKSNPNWKAAADYLYERSKPEVKLLIEAQIQIKADRLQRRNKVAKKQKVGWLGWLLVLLGSVGFVAIVVWIVNNAVIRQC